LKQAVVKKGAMNLKRAFLNAPTGRTNINPAPLLSLHALNFVSLGGNNQAATLCIN
jgi:hypothetical protein